MPKKKKKMKSTALESNGASSTGRFSFALEPAPRSYSDALRPDTCAGLPKEKPGRF
jgi:hypothetical protein